MRVCGMVHLLRAPYVGNAFRVRGNLARLRGSAAPSSPAAHQRVWPNAWATRRSDDRRHPRTHVRGADSGVPGGPKT